MYVWNIKITIVTFVRGEGRVVSPVRTSDSKQLVHVESRFRSVPVSLDHLFQSTSSGYVPTERVAGPVRRDQGRRFWTKEETDTEPPYKVLRHQKGRV